MQPTSKRYTIDELKLGMTVRMSELKDILDTHFILIDTRIIDNDDLIGTLVYFGQGDEEDCDKWFKQSKPITPIYFNSEEILYGVVYDE